ncbi:Transcription factor bHLH25-like protein [Quillaja saponaria]|uniref:Transcription factor bHLH25-like protein n=1 Tax=Quillaja saponaria TaxID=32244 RepID=A0AAD7VNH4_QUISA|nr:Transcription factor bHLH25-like protein [Quillaja saponaria]
MEDHPINIHEFNMLSCNNNGRSTDADADEAEAGSLEENFYQSYFSSELLHPFSDHLLLRSEQSSTNNIPFNVSTIKALQNPAHTISSTPSASSKTFPLRNLQSLQPINYNKNWFDFACHASMEAVQGQKWTSTLKSSHQLPFHIIAERKRREDLNQRYSALSDAVPGIKKKDKASVLGETVQYLKQLQERIKSLEEKNKKRVVESVVFVKDHHSSHQLSKDDDDNLSNYNYSKQLLEIEAKVMDTNILIRVHCQNHKGILAKLMNQIVKLQLVVITSNVVVFGNDTIDITVIAQMEAEFCMKTKDIVRYLQQALQNMIN